MTLSFCKEAQQAFNSIAQKFKLTCTYTKEWCVSYENDIIFLSIYFDHRRSYEIGIEIGQKKNKEIGPSFSLNEILRMKNIPETSFSCWMASDQPSLTHGLETLAQLTNQYATEFLQGDEMAFMALDAFQSRECREYALRTQLRLAKNQSTLAWAKKNYQGVIQALESIEPHLSTAEKKRLEYARKHTQ